MISGSFVVGKTCQLQWLDAKTPEQRTKTSEKNTQIVDNHGKFHQKTLGLSGVEKFKQQQIQLYL